MCLLFETIKIYNHELLNLQYHNERVNRTRYELLGTLEKWDIAKFISIPHGLLKDTVYKCRFFYFHEPGTIDFQLYSMRKINKLRLFECNEIEYMYKFFDRGTIDSLKALNRDVDDIIIVKKEMITDCTYANLVFFDGSDWLTPKYPLLHGTMRRKLLDEKRIVEKIIYPRDLQFFSNLRLINAMIGLDESPDIPISKISSLFC
jgi:4-amino-4-deoxychorismate lyase